jgi:putative membrane protein
MKTWNRKQLGAMVWRGFVVMGVTMGALAIRADDKDSKDSKQSAASTRSAKAGDTETCIKEAAKMNMAVIKVAQLAGQKAENPELKRFAQTLEQDHKKAQKDVESLASKHNVSLPTEVDEKCKEEISKLEALEGREFDREFAKGAVEGHAMAVAHLERASAEAKDTDVRRYTSTMLSQVKDHQRRSREIAKTVGVDQATITSLENKAKEGVGAAAPSETSSEQATEEKPSDTKAIEEKP